MFHYTCTSIPADCMDEGSSASFFSWVCSSTRSTRTQCSRAFFRRSLSTPAFCYHNIDVTKWVIPALEDTCIPLSYISCAHVLSRALVNFSRAVTDSLVEMIDLSSVVICSTVEFCRDPVMKASKCSSMLPPANRYSCRTAVASLWQLLFRSSNLHHHACAILYLYGSHTFGTGARETHAHRTMQTQNENSWSQRSAMWTYPTNVVKYKSFPSWSGSAFTPMMDSTSNSPSYVLFFFCSACSRDSMNDASDEKSACIVRFIKTMSRVSAFRINSNSPDQNRIQTPSLLLLRLVSLPFWVYAYLAMLKDHCL